MDGDHARHRLQHQRSAPRANISSTDRRTTRVRHGQPERPARFRAGFSVVTSNYSAQRPATGIVNVLTSRGRTASAAPAASSIAATGSRPARSTTRPTTSKGEFTAADGLQYQRTVRRDKAHFFSNLEYIRVGARHVISWVPTRVHRRQRATTRTSSPPTVVTSRRQRRADPWRRASIIARPARPLQSLPAGLVFAESSRPARAGGGDPQNDYQWCRAWT